MKQNMRARAEIDLWRSLLALGLLCCAPSLPAAELGGEQVRAAVQTWVRRVTANARPDT